MNYRRWASSLVNVSDYEGQGCILEVDLEYPKELHDLHNDYPLAPERLHIFQIGFSQLQNEFIFFRFSSAIYKMLSVICKS